MDGGCDARDFGENPSENATEFLGSETGVRERASEVRASWAGANPARTFICMNGIIDIRIRFSVIFV